MTTYTPQLNDHNKAEYPPMHNREENHKLKDLYTYKKLSKYLSI